MRQFTVNDIVRAFNIKGYELKTGHYEMNIFGIRNNDTTANTFDDLVGIVYRDEKNNWMIKQYKATTDPGVVYREKPINVKGSAIIVPMQHKKCYTIGLHRGYKAIQQVAPMTYVRDNNKNKVLDFLYKTVGATYIKEVAATNIHHASKTGTSVNVDNWSAGCQVLANINDFNQFMSIIQDSVSIYKHKNVFDYTLFEIEDFNK